MQTISKHYIDGAFVESHGREVIQGINPTNGRLMSEIVPADEIDAQRAIGAAKRGLPAFSRTTKDDRIDILRRMHAATAARIDDLTAAMIEEYGGTMQFSSMIVRGAVQAFKEVEIALTEFEMTRKWEGTTVFYEPVGVAGLITPW